MVQTNDNVVGIEGNIITHPRVWEASGHVENFVDRLVECKNCKRGFRVDLLPKENLEQNKCPVCGGGMGGPPGVYFFMGNDRGWVEGERMKRAPRRAEGLKIYPDF